MYSLTRWRGQYRLAGKCWQAVERYRRGFEVLGGLTLIFVGVYLLNGYYFWL